jgi:Dolichyl-phosphate-mannose-protein mannosyltransferase
MRETANRASFLHERFTLETIRNSFLILAISAWPLILLQPLRNFPMNDDWTYAWAVENLLNTGTLRILDWSTSINVAQVLWGALFCLPWGFSFAALRLSTWVISLLGLWALYLLLRELKVSRRDSLIGTAILGFSPFYFLFSFSFMTDVPFISFTTWSLLAFVKAFGSGKRGWLTTGSVLSALAIATRLPGVAIPVAVGALVVFQKNPRFRKSVSFCIGAVLPLLFTVGLLWWHSHHTEHRGDLTWSGATLQGRTDSLKWGLLYFHKWLFVTIIYSVAPLGIFSAPIAVSSPRWVHYKKILLVLGIVLILFAIGSFTGFSSLQKHGANWKLDDFISSHRLVPGSGHYENTRLWHFMAGSLGVLFFCLALGPAVGHTAAPGIVLLRWFLVLQGGLITVLWLWDARYMLAFLPALFAIMLSAAPIRRPKLALLLIGIFLAVSVGEVHDEAEYNRALWLGVDHLRALGIPVSQINGGYMVNGWLQYAHKGNSRANKKGELLVNWINDNSKDFDYQVSNAVDKGWVKMKEIPYSAWFGASGHLYVLERSGKNTASDVRNQSK